MTYASTAGRCATQTLPLASTRPSLATSDALRIAIGCTLLMFLPGFSKLQIPLRPIERLPLFPGSVRLLFLAWGIPFIQWLIAISNGWFNSTAGPLGCTVDPTLRDGQLLLLTTLLPLMIPCSISSLIIITFAASLFLEGWTIARTQWRLLLVSLIYLIRLWIVMSFTWFAYTSRHENARRVTNAILKSAESGGAVNYASVYHSPINSGWQIFVAGVTSLIPFLMSLSFLISTPYLNFYMRLFTRGRCSYDSEEHSGGSSTVPQTDSVSRNVHSASASAL